MKYWVGAVAASLAIYAAVLAIGFILILLLIPPRVKAHSWYPPHCCSGFDCRPIQQDDVVMTPTGFLIKENGETIPYNSNVIRKTPPEGAPLYHRCSVGGTAEGKTICLYIPNWET